MIDKFNENIDTDSEATIDSIVNQTILLYNKWDNFNSAFQKSLHFHTRIWHNFDEDIIEETKQKASNKIKPQTKEKVVKFIQDKLDLLINPEIKDKTQ